MAKISRWTYQFKVPFMLYASFENILKPVEEQYREEMNKMKTERKGKTINRKHKHICTVRMVCTERACI